MFQRDLHNFNKNAYCHDLHKSLYNFFVISYNFNHDNFNQLFSNVMHHLKNYLEGSVNWNKNQGSQVAC